VSEATVSEAADTLERRYSAALATQLAEPSEVVLHAAYALGRTAAANGLGVVDIAALHNEALRQVFSASGAAPTAAMIDKASRFLSECLAPYEMMLTGYSESNAKLIEANDRLHETQAALETVNHELESFSYSVAHDLRAPLRSVLGFSLALAEDHADQLNEEGHRFLRYLQEAARDMAQLIDDLLMLSRVTRGDLQREHVDVSALAHEVFARLAAGQPERRVRVAIEPGLAARCDARLLAIVLENLIGNALKFTSRRADAHIEIGRVDDAGHPAYFVRDNGAGFDMAYADRLFGVFQRLHNATEFAGTGIGLATVQRVIHRHRGRIRAEGIIGHGATFYFTLGSNGAEGGGK
jgi:light-regulated signal transduction histidine kinase (bacteriophytochrome)